MSSKVHSRKIKKTKRPKELELRGRPSKTSTKPEKISLKYSKIISKPGNLMLFQEYHLLFKLGLEYKFNEKSIHELDAREVPRQEFIPDISTLDEDKKRFWVFLKTIIKKTEETLHFCPEFLNLLEMVAFLFVKEKETVEDKVNEDERIRGIAQKFTGGHGIGIVDEVVKVCQQWQNIYDNDVKQD